MKRTLADVRPEIINEWSQRNLPLSLSGQVLLICYKYYIQNNKFFNNEKKNLPCNKLFLYNPPYHKHIEARMLMVRKTAKQFYIRNTHYQMLASSYFHTPSPGHYLRHYRA